MLAKKPRDSYNIARVLNICEKSADTGVIFMEIWDIYDKDRQKSGEKIVRGEKVPDGGFHLVVHVCVFNPRGEMLIQQRQSFKEGWPNMWDITVGGHSVEGDSSQAAAQRELFEELGLKAELQNAQPHLTVHFEQGFDDFYSVELDADIAQLKLQYEEVKNAQWATKEVIFALIDSGKFIPYYKSFIQLLFDMRKSRGCRNEN